MSRNWTTEKKETYKGFTWLVKHLERSGDAMHWGESGHRCGYVDITGHEELISRVDELGYDNNLIDCHGGVTWYGKDLIGYEDRYLVGFDCNHYQDMEAPKSLKYCEEECKHMIDQIIDLLEFQGRLKNE